MLALSTVGCNAILGLSPTTREVADAARIDADPAAPDAGPAAPDAASSTPDADPVAPDAPPAAPDAPPAAVDAYVECTQDQDCGLPMIGACTMPVCVNHTCAIGPAPRDTLCNNQQDQCDGAGNCIDCTTSGGCGECCVCALGVCVAA